MSDVLAVIKLLISCGTVLSLAFVVLLALPKSKLRAVVLQIVGWVFVVFCGIYCISPVDVLPEIVLGPFGFFDDIAAVVAGFAAASTAIQAGKEHQQLIQDGE